MVTIFVADHRAAACRKHNVIAFRQVADDRRFTPAKTVLAFFLEDKRNVDARAALDLVIAVDELEVQGTSQLPADGRLACAHRANEK